MFRPAVLAAAEAARTWSPERCEGVGRGRCCALCHEHYRVAVLDGPLRDLPHDVAHAAVLVIDAIVAERLLAVDAHRGVAPLGAPLDADGTAPPLSRRSRAARGGLILAAIEELASARAELSHVRLHHIEPVLVGLVAEVRMDGVPDGWA